MDDFEFLLVLGRGAFGKVYLAKLKDDAKSEGQADKFYAIKSIRKHVLLEEGKVDSTMLEKTILLEFKHPNLATMDYLF